MGHGDRRDSDIPASQGTQCAKARLMKISRAFLIVQDCCSICAYLVKASVVAEQTVNVNTATAEMISDHLKGIGLKKAQAIVEWRKANGNFISVEQLTEVKGIGEKTVRANKGKIAL